MNEPLYCSLDIETSGFDPLTNEILEVGFCFFTVSEAGLIITEEWTKVFKPSGEVSANILGLTGITKEELENAPVFSKFKDELQEKLGRAIIVGHNVIFDIKFLEAFGIKFSGLVIDTLDLVQCILPTHHSYNLENLMHVFNVDHKDAHRALADSKAALIVLEKLLRVYQSFPEELKETVKTLMQPYAVPFANLLNVSLAPYVLAKKNSAEAGNYVLEPLQAEFEKYKLYDYPLGKDCIQEALGTVEKSKNKKHLVVVPHQQQVIKLWEQRKVSGVFGPEHLFDSEKFEAFLKKPELTLDELRFAIKILVWKATNWQTECILDLNLSFFGGQFKTYITGAPQIENSTDSVVCTDHKTFLGLVEKGMYKDHFVIIVGLRDYEDHISSNISQKVSWGYMMYILKSYYNPEFGTGNAVLKALVVDALAATDLFFGLVMALCQLTPGFQYIPVNDDFKALESYEKIKAAAVNYSEKLKVFNETLESREIEKSITHLLMFFEPQENRVKWLEFADNRCVFNNNPLYINDLVAKSLAPFTNVVFIDSLGLEIVREYFNHRLGLDSYEKVIVSSKKEQLISIKSQKQGDLLSLLEPKQAVSPKSSLVCYYNSSIFANNTLAEVVSSVDLPAVVLFGSQLQVKEFYEKNYSNLQKKAFLLAQNASGGSNKLVHNFTIQANSLLMATDKLILKFMQADNSTERVEHLHVKTLILGHLPFEQFSHPYQEAVSAHYQNSFEEYSLPRALYNFHCLIQFFYTPDLECVYICDTKLGKGYSKVFKEYLLQIPSITIL